MAEPHNFPKMSGFRNHNLQALGKQTKTLATSMDEEDWTTDDFEQPISSILTSVKSTPIPAVEISQSIAIPTPPVVSNEPSRTHQEPQQMDWLVKKKSMNNIHKAAVITPKHKWESVAPEKPVKSSILTHVHSSAKTIPAKLSREALVGEFQKLNVADNIKSKEIEDLAVKFKQFTTSEIAAFYQKFKLLNNGSDRVDSRNLASLASKAGANAAQFDSKIISLKLEDANGSVTFEGFLKGVTAVLGDQGSGQIQSRNSKKIVLHGHTENTTHTINEDEKESFTIHINQALGHDPLLAERMPIDPKSMQIFSECTDGLILAKLINDSVPGTIDERVLNVNKHPNKFQKTENNNLVINSAKVIGCSVVNIGSSDLMEGSEHLILGLIWQIIKMGLQSQIDITVHPELYRLLNDGEKLEDFLKLPADQILLRWFNYHLRAAGHNKTVRNFTGDVKDGVNYTILLNQLAPELCSKAPLQQNDLMLRAEMILENAEKLGCRKYLTAKTMVQGNQKLNFAFVANLFNMHPGLEELSKAEMETIDTDIFDAQGSRETRQFSLWLNSLEVEPRVNNLFEDCKTGVVLLQAFDKVRPGSVQWTKVNKEPNLQSKFKRVENCNYVIDLAKNANFSVVGIQGSDIVDGSKKLLLGVVWQLMRDHVIQVLKPLSSAQKSINDTAIIEWANSNVRSSGKFSTMANFKDPSLKNSNFFLDLLNSLRPGVVNYDLVSRPATGIFNLSRSGLLDECTVCYFNRPKTWRNDIYTPRRFG